MNRKKLAQSLMEQLLGGFANGAGQEAFNIFVQQIKDLFLEKDEESTKVYEVLFAGQWLRISQNQFYTRVIPEAMAYLRGLTPEMQNHYIQLALQHSTQQPEMFIEELLKLLLEAQNTKYRIVQK